jgi:hypothetical protein
MEAALFCAIFFSFIKACQGGGVFWPAHRNCCIASFSSISVPRRKNGKTGGKGLFF